MLKNIKLVEDTYRVLCNYRKTPPKPLMTHFCITGRCNLKCKFCEMGQGVPDSGDLTTGEIRDIFDELKDWGIGWLYLTGGEPFLEKIFGRSLITARQAGYPFSDFAQMELF